MAEGANASAESDLGCLVLLLRFHGVAVEAEQIRHRLGGRPVDVVVMVRCAKEFELKARVLSSTWARLETTTLPVVVELKDGSFLLLGRIAEGKALVQNPLNGRPELLSRAEFEAAWTGRLVIMVRRASLSELARRLVLITDRPANRAETIIASQALTLLTAAACQVVKPLGVLWCPSDNLMSIDRFIASTNALLANKQTPADIWIRLAAVNTPAGLVVGSHGLANFIGREIEFAPSKASEFGMLGMRTMQTALYLINSGAELKDGETVGPEKFIITHQNTGHLNNGPAYILTAPSQTDAPSATNVR